MPENTNDPVAEWALKECKLYIGDARGSFTSNEELALAEAYLTLARQLRDAREDALEAAAQLCLFERDKAAARKPDPPGSTMNEDHIMGQGWMANLLGKKLHLLAVAATLPATNVAPQADPRPETDGTSERSASGSPDGGAVHPDADSESSLPRGRRREDRGAGAGNVVAGPAGATPSDNAEKGKP